MHPIISSNIIKTLKSWMQLVNSQSKYPSAKTSGSNKHKDKICRQNGSEYIFTFSHSADEGHQESYHPPVIILRPCWLNIIAIQWQPSDNSWIMTAHQQFTKIPQSEPLNSENIRYVFSLGKKCFSKKSCTCLKFFW